MKKFLGPDQIVLHGIDHCFGFTLFANMTSNFLQQATLHATLFNYGDLSILNLAVSSTYYIFIIYHYLKRTAHLAINASLPCVPLKHIYVYTQVKHIYICKQFGPYSYATYVGPGLKVIKMSCSSQLSMKFVLLINVKMPTIVGILPFMSMTNTTSDSLEIRKVNIFQHCCNERMIFPAQCS